MIITIAAVKKNPNSIVKDRDIVWVGKNTKIIDGMRGKEVFYNHKMRVSYSFPHLHGI